MHRIVNTAVIRPINHPFITVPSSHRHTCWIPSSHQPITNTPAISTQGLTVGTHLTLSSHERTGTLIAWAIRLGYDLPGYGSKRLLSHTMGTPSTFLSHGHMGYHQRTLSPPSHRREPLTLDLSADPTNHANNVSIQYMPLTLM